MSKVRVYELAKEYGIKGPELAKMLKELGFEKVKSHMAVLDDATELHARAVIEAQGLTPQQAAAAGASEDDGLPKKKKKLPSLASGTATEEPPGETEDDDAGIPKKKPSKKSLPSPLPRKPAKKKLPGPAVKTTSGASAADDELSPEEQFQERIKASEAVAEAAPTADAPASEAPAAETPTADAPAAESPAAESPAPKAPAAEAPPSDAAATAVPEAAPTAAEPAPAAEAPAASEQAPAAPAPAPAAAEQPAAPAEPPSTPEAPGGTAPEAAAQAGATEAAPEKPAQDVKRLLVPQKKATVVGKIELPQEAIRDAKRRSAPGGAPAGRNPGGVDRNLRRAALRNTQTRSAGGRGRGAGGGPGFRRGPGGPGRRGPGGGRKGGRGGGAGGPLTSTVDPNKEIEIEPPISVKGLSEAMGIKVNDLIAALTFKLGVIGKNINSFLSPDEVELVAIEVGRKIKLVERKEAEEQLLSELTKAAADVEQFVRAPVVTFMGHVDHGKTTLLDALRSSDVVEGESGGITQHVGAYKITWHDGTQFVVLDTPGHEAFTSMRARGAKLTDIVVLVVAADDGVMPQTEEAIAHAKDAGVEIIVAVNKCDTPGANSMQVMQQLAVKGLQPESWGGKTPVVEVSALQKQGLDELVEMIMLQAEVLELQARPEAAAQGIVIESKQSPEMGVVVNVLLTDGTLRVRDQVLCSDSLSRVRGIIDDHGRQLTEAGPSTPVSLLGLTSLPVPGEKLFVVNDKKKAREVVEDRQQKARNKSLAERSRVTAENLSATLAAAKADEVKVILKADVMGSLEPLKDSIRKLETDEVKVTFVHTALGAITEADVSLAEASGAIIIAFNTVADTAARQASERAGVEIRNYDVIYSVLDDMKLILEGKLKPEEVEEALGSAEIRAVFRSSKFGNIAGCLVTDGLIRRNAKVRLSRDGQVLYTGSIATLRREKDDAREVKNGFECGLTLKDYQDIKDGDVLDCFEIKLVKRTLS